MTKKARITRDFPFDAGHRVLGHEGKCANLHGHGYIAEVTVESPEVDSLGRVIDFGVLKDLIGGWIDQNWDHTMILNEKDPLIPCTQSVACLAGNLEKNKPFYVMPTGMNPTAEQMAQHLFCVVDGIFKENKVPKEIKVVKVVIHETMKCRAEWPC